MPAATDTLANLRARYRAARDYVIESDCGPCTVAAFNAWVVGEVGRNPAALVAFAEGAVQEAQEYEARIARAQSQAMRCAEAYHLGYRDA
jgi:hypothetical protein